MGGADSEESDSEEEEEEEEAEEEEGLDLGTIGESVSAVPKQQRPHWALTGLMPRFWGRPCLTPCVPLQCPILGDLKYATCKRTLPRRVREAQMKRFCKAQVALVG